MAASPTSSLPDLIKHLDTLYPILFNLSLKAQEKDDDLDKQIAIEETRKGILDEARLILESAADILKKMDAIPSATAPLQEIEKKLKDFMALLTEIRSLDQERSSVWRQEQILLKQALYQAHLGKRAATTYQKNCPIEG